MKIGIFELKQDISVPGLQCTWEQEKEECFRLTLSFSGTMTDPMPVPWIVAVKPGDVLLLPIGEGFAFPVDDPDVTILPERSGLPSVGRQMAFYGILRENRWLICGIDHSLKMAMENRRNEQGLLETRLLCWHDKDGFGPERTIHFFTGRGGITEACQAYRAYREDLGQVRTLREKRKKLPHLDHLAGAPEFWIWHDRYEELMYGQQDIDLDAGCGAEILRIAKELKSEEVSDALIGIFFGQDMEFAENIRNETGYLVTKYDNLEDELPSDLRSVIPEPRLRQCDYTARLMQNYPNDIMISRDGTPAKAWALRGTDGVMHPQNRMCPHFAPSFTQNTVIPLAKSKGFNAWFFDVMGGGTAECWSKDHPLDLVQSTAARNKAFRMLEEAGMIPGTEEGIECYLQSICYTEGKMSPAQYRINYLESGRKKAHLYPAEEEEPQFRDFMLNPKYRVPLWELVYHDCCVNYWYWGDSTNCRPERMPERDLFDILYGQPPLYSFHVSDWKQLKPAILNSIRRGSSTAKLTMYEKMTKFEYLNAEHTVQRTKFANGISATVNFSGETYNGIEPGGYRIEQSKH